MPPWPRGAAGRAGELILTGRRSRLFLLAAAAIAFAPVPAAAGDEDLLPSLAPYWNVAIAPGEIVATSDDPAVVLKPREPVVLEADHELRLDMRVSAAEPRIVVGQLFLRDRKGDFREESSLKLPIATDGKLHGYDVPLGSFAGLKLAQLRIDPMTEPGTFAIAAATLSRSPPRSDPSYHVYDAAAIGRSWLPGPGLELVGAGRYRVRGPGAYLLSPLALRLDAGRVPICELRLRTRGLPPEATARLAFGPGPLEREHGSIPIRLDQAERAQYLSLVLRPGWDGSIGMLRVDVEAGAGAPSEGAEVELTSLATVPFVRENASSLLLRHARRIAALDPTRWLLGACALLAAAALLVGFVEPARPWILDALGFAAVVGALALPLLFPFDAYPPLATPFHKGTIDPPGCLLLLAFACGVSRRLFTPLHPTLLPAVERPALVFAGVALLATLGSAAPSSSLAVWERHLATIPAALLAGAYAPVSRRSARLLLAALLLAMIPVSLLGILQAFGRKDTLYGDLCRTFLPIYYASNIRPKAFGTLGNPTPLATCLVALIPPAVWVAGRSHGALRWLGVVASAAGGACLCLTSVRGALLGMAAVSPLLWRAIAPERRRALVVLALVVAVASGALLVARRPRGGIHRIQPGARPGDPAAFLRSPDESGGVSASQRILGARIGLAMLRQHPILGAGPGMTRRLYEGFLPAGTVDRNPVWATADDSYVTLVAETGLAGLAAFLALLAGTARMLWGIARARADGDDGSLADAALAATAAVAIHLMFYDGIYWFPAMLVAFTTIGLLVAMLDAMGRERAGEQASACP